MLLLIKLNQQYNNASSLCSYVNIARDLRKKGGVGREEVKGVGLVSGRCPLLVGQFVDTRRYSITKF